MRSGGAGHECRHDPHVQKLTTLLPSMRTSSRSTEVASRQLGHSGARAVGPCSSWDRRDVGIVWPPGGTLSLAPLRRKNHPVVRMRARARHREQRLDEKPLSPQTNLAGEVSSVRSTGSRRGEFATLRIFLAGTFLASSHGEALRARRGSHPDRPHAAECAGEAVSPPHHPFRFSQAP
jgi:hypothetical protein